MTSLCVFLLIACVCDYREHRIPNSLTALMAVQGLIGRMWDEGAVGIILWLGGAVKAVTLLYLLFKIGCLGAGCEIIWGNGGISAIQKNSVISVFFFAHCGNHFSG